MSEEPSFFSGHGSKVYFDVASITVQIILQSNVFDHYDATLELHCPSI